MTIKTQTPWAATATAVRKALKAQREALGLPAEMKISVVSSEFAGGAAVDVHLSGADAWAWERATADHEMVWKGYQREGDLVLTAAARPTGRKIADIIAAHRAAGYIWGGVTYDGASLGTVAREGWAPGQD